MSIGGMRRVDPDHAARSPFNPGARTPQPQHLSYGTPIPGALGGAVAAGNGRVLQEPRALGAATQRMWQQVSEARTGIPHPLPSGDLPAGLHQATWGEVTTRYAHGARRADLTGQLGRALGVMQQAGVEQAMVGGSYVGAKLAPGDVDMAVLPRRDGQLINMRKLERAISQVAPDVHIYSANHLVTNAPELGKQPGVSFLEFFQTSRSGAARGGLLLRPLAPGAVGGGVAQAATAARTIMRAFGR